MKSDALQKLRALMLNRVEGLRWYYFDLNLNHQGAELASSYKRIDVSQFLEQIQPVGDGFEYQSEPAGQALPSALLPALLQYFRADPKSARSVLRSIFDSNEPAIYNGSAHEAGLLGRFNRKSQKHRNKAFRKKMLNGFRRKEGNFVLMVEGDSWFEFPRVFGFEVVKDVVDWLMKKDDLAVYSLAAGGDWLSNMLYSGEYIEALPKVVPDAFLFSGGGNDMLGDHRLASMVYNRNEGPRDLTLPENAHLAKLLSLRINPQPQNLDPVKYEQGLCWLRDEFFQFLNLCLTQYFLLISELNQLPRYQHMTFFTQGYDFVKPSRKHRGFPLSMQRLVNAFMRTGKWLYEPMMMQGITDPEDQQAIVYAMIVEFNELLIQLATYEGFPNLYHIDCRGTGEIDKDWFDEIHLSSPRYEEVAEAYYTTVRKHTAAATHATQARSLTPDPASKVISVREDLNFTNQLGNHHNPPKQRVS